MPKYEEGICGGSHSRCSRQADFGSGVLGVNASEQPPTPRAQRSGDGVDDRSLPGTGLPEQNRYAGRGREINVQTEPAVPVTHPHFQHHRPEILRATCRDRVSERANASTATTIEITTRRRAEDSPPGACRNA